MTTLFRCDWCGTTEGTIAVEDAYLSIFIDGESGGGSPLGDYIFYKTKERMHICPKCRDKFFPSKTVVPVSSMNYRPYLAVWNNDSINEFRRV